MLDARRLHSVRKAYYAAIEPILWPDAPSRKVNRIPVLHGSNLLRDWGSDETRLAAVNALFSAFEQGDARFFRLGYFHDELLVPPGSKSQMVNFCLSNLLLCMEQVGEPFALVSELDRTALRSNPRFADDTTSLHYQAAARHSDDFITIDYANFLGHFIAAKGHLGCQMADIAGYVALKAETASAPFAQSLRDIFLARKDKYLLNEVSKMARFDPHP